MRKDVGMRVRGREDDRVDSVGKGNVLYQCRSVAVSNSILWTIVDMNPLSRALRDVRLLGNGSRLTGKSQVQREHNVPDWI